MKVQIVSLQSNNYSPSWPWTFISWPPKLVSLWRLRSHFYWFGCIKSFVHSVCSLVDLHTSSSMKSFYLENICTITKLNRGDGSGVLGGHRPPWLWWLGIRGKRGGPRGHRLYSHAYIKDLQLTVNKVSHLTLNDENLELKVQLLYAMIYYSYHSNFIDLMVVLVRMK